MIKQLVNKKTGASVALILISWAEITYSADVSNFSNATHPYSSYREFAESVCLPCHYKDIPNGIDLQEIFPNASSETEIKNILLPILRDGNMPPNKVYRKILYDKFLQIQ
ncbi:MAG: hypothetical protein GQ529_03010 [Methyloprofundus sp.]|nr:hypothetical protein [Methyloprofundus sp.]